MQTFPHTSGAAKPRLDPVHPQPGESWAEQELPPAEDETLLAALHCTTPLVVQRSILKGKEAAPQYKAKNFFLCLYCRVYFYYTIFTLRGSDVLPVFHC